MKNIIEKMGAVQKAFKAASKEAAELVAERESIQKDPCRDYDTELEKEFDSYLLEVGSDCHMKEDDNPMYRESFCNWLDGILRDDSLANYLPEYADLLERESNIEMYKDDIEEALESLEEALDTFSLMIS